MHALWSISVCNYCLVSEKVCAGSFCLADLVPFARPFGQKEPLRNDYFDPIYAQVLMMTKIILASNVSYVTGIHTTTVNCLINATARERKTRFF